MPLSILLLLPPSSECADNNNDYNQLNVRTMSMIMATRVTLQWHDEW